jgi:hypothetical protein
MFTWFGIIGEGDFENHAKCPSCMIGKATREDFQKGKYPINKPLYQVYMDSFTSFIKPIEGLMTKYREDGTVTSQTYY